MPLWTATVRTYDVQRFKQDCDDCGKSNEVVVYRQDGNNRYEPIHCAECAAELGTIDASLAPRTSIFEPSDRPAFV
jgi:hypothetical protein